MALLWRDFLYLQPGDGTVLAPSHCDAVESATQKESGGVLSRSPKNEKSNLTATLCEPIAQMPGPSKSWGRKERAGWQQWWGRGRNTIPEKQTKPSQPIELEILKKKHPACQTTTR